MHIITFEFDLIFVFPAMILFSMTERQQTFGEKVIASLQVNNVQVDDGGSYVCQASNVYGRDQQLVQLYVQEPPSRPNDLRVITITSTTMNVQWDHNGDQTSKYIVQHKKSDGTLDTRTINKNIVICPKQLQLYNCIKILGRRLHI